MVETTHLIIRDNNKVFINGKQAKNIKYIVLDSILKEGLVFPIVDDTYGTFVIEYVNKEGELTRHSFPATVYDIETIVDYDKTWQDYYFTISRFT